MSKKQYRHLVRLKGCSFLYTDIEHPTYVELWNEYRYGISDVHLEDLDVEHIETYEIDEDYNEIRKVEPKENK